MTDLNSKCSVGEFATDVDPNVMKFSTPQIRQRVFSKMSPQFCTLLVAAVVAYNSP